MYIGNVEIEGKALLAPMAGVADRAFRELCMSYGAAGVTSEMVSAKGFTMGDRKSKSLLMLSDKERPAAVQIFGDNPKILAEAARNALQFEPNWIDINMGCPAPKIVGNGGGSSLMKNPPLAEEIARAVVKELDGTNVPVTVKFRTGWDSEHINCVEFAKRMEDAGVAAVTVHGRTKEQMYAPGINYDAIAAVKQAVNIPVIGNGDIIDGPTASAMLERTGCDAVAVGRGAQGRPWVFQQINGYLSPELRIVPEPPMSEIMRVMINHVQKICEYKGERIGIKEARKHAAWYIRGVKGAAQYRAEIGRLESLDELYRFAAKVVESDRD
ncbi:MAG: tRNA dihydrouridine synthase DusB [Clostridia bacterium]|nr:tRNA dihydrouridine synthase DusB [Clostridia bacterium]